MGDFIPMYGQGEHKPKLIGIVGDRGDGKTLLLTALLREDYDNGLNIFSNYSLFFPKPRFKGQLPPQKRTFKDIVTMPEELRNASVGLDELHIGADSRQSMNKSNLILSKLITQMRKRNLDVYYTTQRLNSIDKRLRQQTDFFIMVERVYCSHDKFDEQGVPQELWFKYQIIDAYYYDTMNTKGDKEGFIYYGATKDLFELYDTDEIIDYDDEEAIGNVANAD